MKEVYPCKIIAEKIGGYSVIFPDFCGATQGETLFEAIEMAEDFANFAVTSLEDDGDIIPRPTSIDKIKINEGEIIQLVRVDTDFYRKNHSKKLHESWVNPKTEKKFWILSDDEIEVKPKAEKALREMAAIK